ncbi:MAG TPA: uroporphyrinogen decarboxylase family protein [Anaerolineales bacterium]|jgi:hypothetical protein
MAATSRELVYQALKFESPARVPRDLWLLPWASNHYPRQVEEIQCLFPSDFVIPPAPYRPSSDRQGDPYVVGSYIDEWGCTFSNVQAGVHGEVRHPLVKELADWRLVQPPYETLPSDWESAREQVNRFCAQTDQFTYWGACPRPWERYQFIRGSFNTYKDIYRREAGFTSLLGLIQDYYLKELEFWCSTDVDAVNFMDDWGAQHRMLISPQVWREVFKPLYHEYCEMAHAHGKFIFMHSDGYILDIIPDLVEIGVDALNSQLFCMDMRQVAERGRGRITFWGEIDRQHVLPESPEKARAAVRQVAQHLYDPRGGVIAQLEFGPGGNPQAVLAAYDEWNQVSER